MTEDFYCYGLERHDRNGATMYAHGGDANGIAAYTQYFLEDDICIIMNGIKRSKHKKESMKRLPV